MNEQELADLFSTQIDRLLSGESAVDPTAAGDLSLFTLGQQLTEFSFQPGSTAQATFQSQMASWFGPAGGNLSTTALGGPKILLMSLGAVLTIISAGLGVVVLISLIWTGALFYPSHENRPRPEVPSSASPDTPQSLPVIGSPEVKPSPIALPTVTPPGSTSSLKDILPTPTTVVSDTILRPTATPTSTTTSPLTTVTPNSVEPGEGNETENGDSSGDNTPTGDHDRGHGNDPDGYDEDNPGQSDGVSGGNGQNNNNGGISPDNLSGGGAGGAGNSGGGNAGGGGNGNGGNNDGGNGGGQGNSNNGGKK